MALASVCILSYNRPQFVQEAIRSAREAPGMPIEIIVHDDGSNRETQDMLHDMLQAGEFSKLIMNAPGHNEGVGQAVKACFEAAQGDYLIKADQDLLFKAGWLTWATDVLRNADIGMAGWFHYLAPPVVSSEMLIAEHDGWQEHKDFVSSAFIIPAIAWRNGWRNHWTHHSAAFAEDVLFKLWLQEQGYKLALPDYDMVVNRGFGLGPSTVAIPDPDNGGKPMTSSIQQEPLIFSREAPTTVTVSQAPDVGSGEPESIPEIVDVKHFEVGVVITSIAGREQNLMDVLSHLDRQTVKPRQVVVVWDGSNNIDLGTHPYAIRQVEIPKHGPGQEQPRNVGVRHLQEVAPDCNYVWFLDSDIVIAEDCLEWYRNAHFACAGVPHIMVGPYVFMPPGLTGVHPEQALDTYRNPTFADHPLDRIDYRNVGAGLACFGGNLVWPIEEFVKIGGFHPNLHHGRCEDGELGLRAMSHGIGVSFVKDARGYHQWHPIDQQSAIEKNARDVPILNAMHPWVQGEGLIVTAEDGARFDFVCPKCGEQSNSLNYWAHMSAHQ